MSELTNKSRLKWACRRGMLELDVLFMPFVDEAYDDLSEQDKVKFQNLLECDDPDLFAWFMGHGKSDNAEHQYMVSLILKRVKV
ncbi:FAD assembly factor SdhE [Flocculibacter collagenilyticus]|uniref:FAD assembly factor SdhE n=1 Tax=Flocculibacter collagenilyticus TaxID=2744479 RepID=UPI0018F476CF|nr:succinate dehydrogenase assembly factor 2 [Flocculibacter collagenilyticus]